MDRRAKIVATLGPASNDETTVARMFQAGVDVVRLNLSHGSAESHRAAIALVRRLSETQGRPIPIVADLMGPRYRLAELPDGPIQLEADHRVSLGTGTGPDHVPLDSPELIAHLKPGERILIDNGLVELAVEESAAERVVARVVVGGPAGSRKGINLPDTELPFEISAKDRHDVALAVEAGADFLAASYVGNAADLEAVREASADAGGALPVIAKLERGRAVEHLEQIVAAADGIMVARGDLGVEVPLHNVPVLQKRIVDTGRRAGKPVIVATQMLESMIQHPRPTRAEASDVANAVFEGADALMLSGETATGDHPVEAVRTMCQIVLEAESYARETLGERRLPSLVDALELPHTLRPARDETVNPLRDTSFEIPDVVAAAAVFAARQLGVRQIVAFSQGGFTARSIARYRPPAPILVFTNDETVARRIQLLWGVHPQPIETLVEHHDEVVQMVDRKLLETGLAEPGETIIILMGDPIRERPLTNLMRIHRVRRA